MPLLWALIAIAGAATAYSAARTVEAVTDDPDEDPGTGWPAVALSGLAVAIAVWALVRR